MTVFEFVLTVVPGAAALVILLYTLANLQAHRRRASLENDAAGPTSVVNLGNLAQSLLEHKQWRRALADLGPILERAIEESADRQDRDAVDIAHDVINNLPFALKHNLYELDELAVRQLTGPCEVVWNLSDTPLDVVPLKHHGWYERTRAFLNARGEIVFFQSSSTWVDALRSMLQADKSRNPAVILDQSQEGCQLWEVPCPDALGLLLPEIVIWDPGEPTMCAQLNSGDSIRVERSKTGFTLLPNIKLCVREPDPKLLSQRYGRALELYNTFVEERRASGLPMPLGKQELRKQPLDRAELRTVVSDDRKWADALIDEAASNIERRKREECE